MKTFLIDLKTKIFSIFKGKSNEENLFNLDGRVPIKKAIPFGLQHILAMFFANFTPLVLVFNQIGIFNTKLASDAMIGSIFMSGIGTMIQLLIGARLPILVGSSFTFSAVCMAIGTSSGGGEVGYYTILGSTLVGGLIAAVLALFAKCWKKLIKPIVPCIVILAIGLSLLKNGVTQFLGGNEVINNLNTSSLNIPFYYYIIVASITLISALLWQIFTRGIWKNLYVIFGVVVGYIVCLFIPNMLDFSSLTINSVSDVVALPNLIDLGKLKFDVTSIILVIPVFLISFIEEIGNSTALCSEGLNRQPTYRETIGSLFCNSINSSVCALFGTIPLATYSQNVNIVTQTKIVNKFTLFIGSLILIILSFFPIAVNFLFTIPDCVLGGVMVILFGSIFAVGIKMCSNVGLNNKNILIIALSTGLGFGLTLNTELFTYLDSINLSFLSSLLSNNILVMFIISLILSWIIPEKINANK